MNKLLDLRFVIGSFFSLVGLLILIYSFISSSDGSEVNRWCGIVFVLFGIFMIVLSLQKDAGDELLKD